MKEREKDIQKLCSAVLEISPTDTGDYGSGACCPFCKGEGPWNGYIEDMKHEIDCAYLIAKDLSTNINHKTQ